VCRDTNSSAATGILLPYRNITSDEAINCAFFIVAPPGQQIKITCSTINIIGDSGYFRVSFLINVFVTEIEMTLHYNWPFVLNVKIGGSVEYGYEVVVNRDYYSKDNSLSVTASFDYPDWFEFKWTTLPKDNTTNFKRNCSIFNQHDQEN
jgi:hypothetical protein